MWRRKCWITMKTKKPKEKLIRISQLVTSCVVLIAAFLRYRNIWPNGFLGAIPLLGILQFLNVILYWKTDRDKAAISLFIGCFIFLSVLVFFVCKKRGLFSALVFVCIFPDTF